jgi:hypothetical protein
MNILVWLNEPLLLGARVTFFASIWSQVLLFNCILYSTVQPSPSRIGWAPLITPVLLPLQLGLQRPQKSYCNVSSKLSLRRNPDRDHQSGLIKGKGYPDVALRWKNAGSSPVPFPFQASPFKVLHWHIHKARLHTGRCERGDRHICPGKNVCVKQTFTAPAANGRRKAEKGTPADWHGKV